MTDNEFIQMRREEGGERMGQKNTVWPRPLTRALTLVRTLRRPIRHEYPTGTVRR